MAARVTVEAHKDYIESMTKQMAENQKKFQKTCEELHIQMAKLVEKFELYYPLPEDSVRNSSEPLILNGIEGFISSQKNESPKIEELIVFDELSERVEVEKEIENPMLELAKEEDMIEDEVCMMESVDSEDITENREVLLFDEALSVEHGIENIVEFPIIKEVDDSDITSERSGNFMRNFNVPYEAFKLLELSCEENVVQVPRSKVFVEMPKRKFVTGHIVYFGSNIWRHATLIILPKIFRPSPEPPPLFAIYQSKSIVQLPRKMLIDGKVDKANEEGTYYDSDLSVLEACSNSEPFKVDSKPTSRNEFSTFDGTNPRSWVLNWTGYFRLIPKMSDQQKIYLASSHFEGRAATWYGHILENGRDLTWDSFVNLVLARFENLIERKKILAEINHLNTEYSLEQNIDEFEERMPHLLLLNASVCDETYFMNSFVSDKAEMEKGLIVSEAEKEFMEIAVGNGTTKGCSVEVLRDSHGWKVELLEGVLVSVRFVPEVLKMRNDRIEEDFRSATVNVGSVILLQACSRFKVLKRATLMVLPKRPRPSPEPPPCYCLVLAGVKSMFLSSLIFLCVRKAESSNCGFAMGKFCGVVKTLEANIVLRNLPNHLRNSLADLGWENSGKLLKTIYGDQVRIQQVRSEFVLSMVRYESSPDGWVEIQLRPSLEKALYKYTLALLSLGPYFGSTNEEAWSVINDRTSALEVIQENTDRALMFMEWFTVKKKACQVFEVGKEVYHILSSFQQNIEALCKNQEFYDRYFGIYEVIGKDEDHHLQIYPLKILDKHMIKQCNADVTQLLSQSKNSGPTFTRWADHCALLICFLGYDPWGQGSSSAGGNVMTHDGDGGGNNGDDGGELKNGNNFESEVGLSFAAGPKASGPKFINESGPNAIGDWKKLIKYFNCYFQILIVIRGFCYKGWKS